MSFKEHFYVDRKKEKVVLSQLFAGMLTIIIILSFLIMYASSIPDQNLKEIKVTAKRINYYFEKGDTLRAYIFTDSKAIRPFHTDSVAYHKLEVGESYYFLVDYFGEAEFLK